MNVQLIYLKCAASCVYNDKSRIYLAGGWILYLFLIPEFIFYSKLWKLNNLDSLERPWMVTDKSGKLEDCLFHCLWLSTYPT